jgi:hypothetical protein
MDDIENTASSIVACWTPFTELLPGNVLIKSVIIYRRELWNSCKISYKVEIFDVSASIQKVNNMF